MPKLAKSKLVEANNRIYELGVENITNPPSYGEQFFDCLSEDRSIEIRHEYYVAAEDYYKKGNLEEAKTLFLRAGEEGNEFITLIEEEERYEEAVGLLEACYKETIENLDVSKYSDALSGFRELRDFKDSVEKYYEVEKLVYQRFLELIGEDKLTKAEELLLIIPDYEETPVGNEIAEGFFGKQI